MNGSQCTKSSVIENTVTHGPTKDKITFISIVPARTLKNVSGMYDATDMQDLVLSRNELLIPGNFQNSQNSKVLQRIETKQLINHVYRSYLFFFKLTLSEFLSVLDADTYEKPKLLFFQVAELSGKCSQGQFIWTREGRALLNDYHLSEDPNIRKCKTYSGIGTRRARYAMFHLPWPQIQNLDFILCIIQTCLSCQ